MDAPRACWSARRSRRLALYAFYRVERTAAAPLLPLHYFRRRNFTASQICAIFMGGAYMGGFILSPLLDAVRARLLAVADRAA